VDIYFASSLLKKMSLTINRTPKDIPKSKQGSTSTSLKLPVENQTLTSIIKNLLESDASILQNAIAENLKSNIYSSKIANDNGANKQEKVQESNLLLVVKEMTGNQKFINGVVKELTISLLHNEEFSTAWR